MWWPFKRKPKPIESNMLVDPKIVPELMRRWETWHEMLEALKVAHEWMGYEPSDTDETETFDLAEDTVTQAIKKAESR